MRISKREQMAMKRPEDREIFEFPKGTHMHLTENTEIK